MTGLADSFRDSLKKYIHIDPFTMPDPFTDKDDYDYFVIADKRQLNWIVAIIAINKDVPPQRTMGQYSWHTFNYITNIKTKCSRTKI